MRDKIHALRELGKSYQEICDELGCAKSTVSYYCGEGQKLKNITRQKDRRNAKRKYIQSVKSSASCTDCKEKYPYWVLQFDHLGDKSFTIGMLGQDATLEDLKAEIAKCEIVCANCHANRTYTRKLKTGGDTM